MANPPSTFSEIRYPIVDQNGMLTQSWLKKFREYEAKLHQTMTLLGEIDSRTKVQGRSDAIGITVQQLDSTGKLKPTGVGFTTDHVPDGNTYGKTVLSALNAGQVDLSKVGVIGPLGSTKINQNVMNNYSNNATVDSIDNGVNATIRVYGPGGAGTSWHQFIGSTIGPEIPAFSGTAAYSSDFNVYYDGSYHITVNGSDTLPDGIKFSGAVHTVAAGGAGGTSGGGGGGGGVKGSQRL